MSCAIIGMAKCSLHMYNVKKIVNTKSINYTAYDAKVCVHRNPFT